MIEEPTQHLGSNITSTQRLKPFFDTINENEREKLDTCLARTIYASCLPFSLVNNKYFIEFMKQIRPSYTIPGRNAIANRLLDDEYKRITNLIKSKIDETDSITIMTDGWTDINGIPLINIILSTPEPIFYKAIDSQTEPHTGEYIFNVLKTVINDVGGSEKVHAVVCDNARNMKVACNLLKLHYPNLITYGCIAHRFNLLCKDIISHFRIFTDTVARLKKIIQFFKNKHIPKQVLKGIQLIKINKEIALLVPTETRWGSVALSLESLIKNKEYLQAAVIDSRLSSIIDNYLRKIILDEETFWPKVTVCFNILNPVAIAIKKLEGDKPSLSNVYPTLKEVESSLQNLESIFFNDGEKTDLLKIFSNRKEFMFHKVQLAACLLHPKLHGSTLNDRELEDATHFIIDYAEAMQLDSVLLLTDIAEYNAKINFFGKNHLWTAGLELDPLTWWKGS